MMSLVIALAGLVLSQDGVVFRFGGEAAVPGRDASAEAPVEVALRPFKADAIYRTRSGAWRFYDGARDRVVELPIVGESIVGWSANGGSFLTSLASGTVFRWKAGTWAQLAEMKTASAPEASAVSSDGHHVLVAGPNPDGAGRRFTLFGGTIGLYLARIDRADAPAGAPIALSDERAAIVRKAQIEILTLPRLEAERVIAFERDVRAIGFAAEGAELLVMTGNADLTIERFAIATGERLGTVALPPECRRAVISANGAVAACVIARPTRALIVDLPAGTTRATIPAPTDVDPVLDASGTRVAFAGNRAVPVWDATADGVLPAAARAGVVKTLALARDGQIVSLEAGGVVRVWDPATGTEALRIVRPAAAVATSPDGAVLVVAGTPLSAVDVATGDILWTVKGSRPIAVAAAGDGRVFWIERDGDLKVRSAAGKVKRLVRRPRGPKPTVGNVPQLMLSPDGQAIAFGTRVIDATSGKPARDLAPGLAAWVGTSVAVANGAALATPELTFLPPADGAVPLIALAGGDGFVASGDKDGVVKVWTASGASVLKRGMHRGPVLALVVDGARRRVYSAGADGVILGTTW